MPDEVHRKEPIEIKERDVVSPRGDQRWNLLHGSLSLQGSYTNQYLFIESIICYLLRWEKTPGSSLPQEGGLSGRSLLHKKAHCRRR